MSSTKWFDIYEENSRKAIASDLIRGGLEIHIARIQCNLEKMPMQYYMQVHGIKKPKLGASQRGLGIHRIRDAVTLLEQGAVPEEVLFLTGVGLQTLLRVEYPLPPPGRQRRSKQGRAKAVKVDA